MVRERREQTESEILEKEEKKWEERGDGERENRIRIKKVAQ